MIHDKSDGHLECDMHAGQGYMTWCSHIADFVSEGRDAQFIHPADGTVIVQTPMLPSMNIFQEVQLEPLVARARGVCVIEFEFEGSAYSAGHLMPGEGRGIIRENLVQWMIPQSPSTGWGCDASVHGWSERNRLNIMKADRYTAWLMEQWCMMVNKMCTVCYRKYLDMGDVVPTGT